jgi:UDP-N-acetylglucosamine 2-epimerase (non-hydrolysing)
VRSTAAAKPIAFVFGTRPEAIKIAPLVHEFTRRGVRAVTIHTGQHFSRSMSSSLLDELGLGKPTHQLRAPASPDEQLGTMISSVSAVLRANPVRAVVVQGDTNSVLAGAIAAHQAGTPVVHLEAGLRASWEMPEERNRVLTARLASLHLCPTPLEVQHLAAEGIHDAVFMIGNTVVDATLHFGRKAVRSSILEQLGLAPRSYFLTTLHRPWNVDDRAVLQGWMRALAALGRRHGAPIVFPVHPRTASRLHAFGLSALLHRAPFVRVRPLGYLDALRLLASANCVLSDSGGLQEEACTLRVPMITIRPNTDRPQTVAVGANVLCATPTVDALDAALGEVRSRSCSWANPYGDGRAAVRAADIVLELDESARRGAPLGTLDQARTRSRLAAIR